MFSLKQCAVLATALAASVSASPAHESLHKRHAAPAPAPIEKRDFLGGVFNSVCLEGANINDTNAPISLSDNGPYVVDFVNESPYEIGLVLWSAFDQESSWSTFIVKVTTPNITVTIASGENATISFDPSLYTAENGYPGAAGSMSGGFAAVYPGTSSDFSGGISNTWGEFTWPADSVFSTLDVSRLVNMTGTAMTIQTFASKGSEVACTSDMDTCVYVCPENEESCNGADCSNCEGNTGCMGMGPTGGYAITTFH